MICPYKFLFPRIARIRPSVYFLSFDVIVRSSSFVPDARRDRDETQTETGPPKDVTM